MNMKNFMAKLSSALVFGAALVQPLSLAAQNTKPSSVVSLADLKAQLTLLQSGISATMESLERVKASNDESLVRTAADFQNRFKQLELQVGTVRTQAVLVKARASEHYESWQKDLAGVQNPKIREKAQQRFTDSRKEFDKIVEKAEKAKEDALPLVSDLKDIVIYLQADLSGDAVKSLSNNIWKLGVRSKGVISKIGDVTEQIDRTIASLPKT
jgi:hypothetical protein